MKRFQLLLLDAGPIIKLFELGLWEKFIDVSDVTVVSKVAEEAKWASLDFEDIKIDLDRYQEHVNIIETETSIIRNFYTSLPIAYKDYVEADDGEVQTLAFLRSEPADCLLCSADAAVFRILGFLGRGEQGISLEEILTKTGLQANIRWEQITPRDEDWKYTKKFREVYTRKGWIDGIQGQGLNG
jgi:hypothetical protein